MMSFKNLSESTQTGSKEFKFEVLICFWFSIHLDLVEIAKELYNLDPIIE